MHEVAFAGSFRFELGNRFCYPDPCQTALHVTLLQKLVGLPAGDEHGFGAVARQKYACGARDIEVSQSAGFQGHNAARWERLRKLVREFARALTEPEQVWLS